MRLYKRVKELLLPTQLIDKNLNIKLGFIMWSLLIFSYALFVVNWGFVTGLNGQGGNDPGILSSFFKDGDKPSSFEVQATNWAITLGRGFGSILIGWMIVKFTHKNSVVIALSLCLFAIPAPYMPSYALFVIFRTIFAIGGSTLMILFQPLVTAYFKQKTKGMLSSFSTWGYPIGAIIVLVPFAFNIESAKVVRSHWQLILLISSSLYLIPLILYLILGQRFDLYRSYVISLKEKHLKELVAKGLNYQRPTIKMFLRKKSTYKWAIFYGSWLIAVTLPFVTIRDQLPNLVLQIYNHKDVSIKEIRALALPIIALWLILFNGAIILAPYTVGLWNRLNARRKPFIITILLIGILLWIISILCFIFLVGPNLDKNAINKNIIPWSVSIPFLVLGFFAGLLLWGIQGVFLNNPHEIPENTSEKIAMQFGFIWGFGYFFFTMLLIIISLLEDFTNHNLAPWLWFSLTIIFTIIAPITWYFMSETKPGAPLIPKRKNQ
ncbi:hypothetical protein DEH79_02450 [Mycoplasmopsis synoviae]|uniref:hexose phosphate transporter n=1 Tax=Mycoplasmopsis synoviae TaxID=2109 RepID=UPI000D225B45|nr:hexose phosphate transporter [Mycoplasmopsis synoviae]AQU48025.1 Hexosephosphate transport protein [Mycoplasmopsis synoviae]QLE13982.1 hypothetical protein DEH79_02450 [Mycoplasmopsis synoviae]